MIVNIDKLEVSNTQLNKLIEEYQENIESLYGIYKNIDSSWYDSDSYKFSVQTSFEHTKILKYYNELKNLSNYYSKVIKEYSPIGKNIDVNIEVLPTIINKLNTCISLIKKIIIRFNNINIRLLPELKVELDSIFRSINKILKSLTDLNDSIRDLEKRINVSEKNIHTELLKFDISEIKVDYDE